MRSEQISISVAPEAQKLGINVVAAVFTAAQISNKRAALEEKKKELITKIASVVLENNPILAAYRELHEICGTGDIMPPAEHLITLLRKNGRLPNINTAVDSYNLVSAESFLSIGAHDLSKVKGNLAIKVTDGSELYVPLGAAAPEKVKNGGYACVDAEKIVCRMDVKQCEQTKVTKETTEFIVYIQGNKNTTMEYLAAALDKVCKYICEFCNCTVLKRI